jgi:hypothetical protein
MQLQVTCSCGKSFLVADYLENRSTICPHCGRALTATGTLVYSQRTAARASANQDFAYSGFSDLVLTMAAVVALLSGLLTVGWSIVALVNGDLWNGLAMGPLGTILQIALVIVFLRVRHLTPAPKEPLPALAPAQSTAAPSAATQAAETQLPPDA